MHREVPMSTEMETIAVVSFATAHTICWCGGTCWTSTLPVLPHGLLGYSKFCLLR
jgi:hypothetical protein